MHFLTYIVIFEMEGAEEGEGVNLVKKGAMRTFSRVRDQVQNFSF